MEARRISVPSVLELGPFPLPSSSVVTYGGVQVFVPPKHLRLHRETMSICCWPLPSRCVVPVPVFRCYDVDVSQDSRFTDTPVRLFPPRLKKKTIKQAEVGRSLALQALASSAGGSYNISLIVAARTKAAVPACPEETGTARPFSGASILWGSRERSSFPLSPTQAHCDRAAC